MLSMLCHDLVVSLPGPLIVAGHMGMQGGLHPPPTLLGQSGLAQTHEEGMPVVRSLVDGGSFFYAWDAVAKEWLLSLTLTPLLRAQPHAPSLSWPVLASLVGDLRDATSVESPYREVRALPPACRMRLSADGQEALLPTPLESPAPLLLPPPEAAAELRTRVLQAVADALEGHTRVAVLTGGGVDSSALLAAAVAARRGATPCEVTALALSFGGHGDDRPYLRDLCGSLGLVPIRVPPEAGAPFVRSALVMDASPHGMPNSACVLALLERARAEGATCVLMGMGGDDLFDGDLSPLADRFAEGDWAASLLFAHRLGMTRTCNGVQRLVREVGRRVLPPSMGEAYRALRGGGALPRAPWLSARKRGPFVPQEAFPLRSYAGFLRSPHRAALLRSHHQLEATSGCRLAYPFLDPRVVSFVHALPRGLLLHGDRRRGLFRLAMQGLLPDSVRLRPGKARFETAQARLVESLGGLEALADLAELPRVGGLGVVDCRAFACSFRAMAANPLDVRFASLWIPLWSALAVEAFLQANPSL